MRGWWLVVLLLVACGGEPGLPVDTWRVAAGPGAGAEVHIPIRHPELDEPTRFVYQATVELPPHYRGRPLTLAIPTLRAPAELRVHGDEMPENVPADDWLRQMGPRLFHIPPRYTADATILLELTVDVQSRLEGTLALEPRLSTDPAGDAHYRAVRAYSALVLPLTPMLLVFLALVHTLLWWLDRRQVAYGWFSLQGFAAALYAAIASGAFFPVTGEATAALAGMALCSSATGAIFFMHRQFGLGRVPRYVTVSWAAVIVLGLFFAHDAFLSESWFTPIYVAQGLMCVTHAIIVHGMRVLARTTTSHRDSSGMLLLVAWCTIGLASIPEAALLLADREILGGFRVFPLSTAVFAGMQTVALSLAHARSLRDAQHLNDELRRQIQERSRSIRASLGRVVGQDETVQTNDGEDVIEGRYRVLRPLGIGGMGVVFEVERLSDGTRLALKRLRRANSPELLARFAREAEIAASFQHPHLVSVVDMGVASDGGMFMVMEMVGGGSARDARGQYGNRRWALRVLSQVASGLAELHEHGIVHRDLKPGNVLLEEPTSASAVNARIADFGISMLLPDGPEHTVTARSQGESAEVGEVDASGITRTGIFLGTPLYIAPEQAMDPRDATPASDMYSFGILAHELLSGTRADRPSDIRFAALSPPLPEPLKDLLDACLAPTPIRRPSARSLADALDREAR